MIKRFFIVLIIVVFVFTGCSTEDPQDISVDGESTPELNETATPVQATPTLTPEPTPRIEMFVYIDDIEPVELVDTLFIGEWVFQGEAVPITMNNVSYTKGIGMYIPSKDMTNEKSSLSFEWVLNTAYHKITFDLGCEQTNQYAGEEKYGKYEVVIIADGQTMWESGFHDFSYVVENVEVMLPADCGKLEVKLSQYKGTNGTLNVVMGDFKLYAYQVN